MSNLLNELEALGPYSPPTPAQEAHVRDLFAGQPDTRMLLAMVLGGRP